MIIKLVREVFTEKSTIGRLYIDGQFECYTLEDKDRGLTSDMSIEDIFYTKIPNKTCIPYGTYRVNITYSEKYGKNLPILLEVPGFSGIRIHPGNVDEDTSGCILTGISRKQDFIGGSRIAYNTLYPKIKKALQNQEEVTISIIKL